MKKYSLDRLREECEKLKIPFYLYELSTLFHAYWSKGNEDKKYKFIENLKFSKKKFTIDELKEEFISSIQSFNEIGELNFNSSSILNLNLLRKISSIIKSLDLDKAEKDNLIFDFELELSKTDSNEINKKIQTIKRKISDLEVESNQFQNNLEFFSSSSSENPLFKNVSTKIE